MSSENDTAPEACRGCLASGVKLYSIQESRLVDTYVQLVGMPLQDYYTHHRHLCCICTAILRKLALFRERFRKAYQLLIDAEFHQKCITTYIKDIDVHTYSNQLKLPYAQSNTLILYVGKTEDEIEDYDLKQDNIDSCEAEKKGDTVFLIDEDDNTLYLVECDAPEENVNENVNFDKNLNFNEDVNSNEDVNFNENENFYENVNGNDIGNDTNKVSYDTDDDTEDRTTGFNLDNTEVLDTELYENFKFDLKKKPFTSITEEEIINYANYFGFDVKFLTEEEQYDEVEKRKNMKTKRPTQCKYCGKNCTTQTLLEKHYELNHNKKFKLVCKLCGFTFKANHMLMAHYRKHKVLFRCKLCSLTTKYKEKLKLHYWSHKGKKYACKYCGSEFGKKSSFLSHVRLQHGSELPWCRLCGESFVNERGVLMHTGREHKAFPKLSCLHCGANFSCQSALDKHVELNRCDLESCTQCGEAFSTEQLLKYHVIHHQRATAFACEACSVKFHNRTALDRHRQACGTAIPCVQCGAHFDDEAAILEHVNKEHTAGFQCVECNKTFKSAYYYKLHLSRHKSTDGKRLKIVRRRRHPSEPRVARWRAAGAPRDLGDSPEAKARAWAMCEVCGTCFNSKARLEYHQIQHSDLRPFQCQHCSKSFRYELALESHIRIHTGEKPYKCELCSKTFRCPTNLYRHQLVHNGVRNHVCHICEKRFQTSTCVKSHIKYVHMKFPAPPRVRRRRKMAAPED